MSQHYMQATKPAKYFLYPTIHSSTFIHLNTIKITTAKSFKILQKWFKAENRNAQIHRLSEQYLCMSSSVDICLDAMVVVLGVTLVDRLSVGALIIHFCLTVYVELQHFLGLCHRHRIAAIHSGRTKNSATECRRRYCLYYCCFATIVSPMFCLDFAFVRLCDYLF